MDKVSEQSIGEYRKYPLVVWLRSQPLQHWIIIYNPYSAGIDFSRQNLTSVDVRFWQLKSITAL